MSIHCACDDTIRININVYDKLNKDRTNRHANLKGGRFKGPQPSKNNTADSKTSNLLREEHTNWLPVQSKSALKTHIQVMQTEQSVCVRVCIQVTLYRLSRVYM